MIFKPPANFVLFKQRRNALLNRVQQKYQTKKGVIIISAGFEHDRHVFRQESSFYYLTGITDPAVILCIFLDGREVLYVPQFGTARKQWTTVLAGSSDDAGKVSVDEIRYLGQTVEGYSFKPVFTREKYEHLVKDISSLVAEQGTVFTMLDQSREGYWWHINWYNALTSWIPALKQCTHDISPLLHDMRRVKDEYEIDLIFKAVQITNMAHRAVASLIADGVGEHEILAAAECVFMQAASSLPAFPSIVAAGANTTVLHYTQRGGQLKDGDLVVVDIGSEYGLYASDVTRTFPVGKKFSARQREIYNIVLEAQAYVEAQARPGMYLKNPQFPEKSLHHLAVKFLEKRGLGQYFYHGIGHFLGLDVHDVGDLASPLMPGDIFTLEPGVYIPQENIGIRIEDDFVMADDGAVCLSYELPKQAEEIEQLMSAK